MANQPGDIINTSNSAIFIIEASVAGSGFAAWTPLSVRATLQSRRLLDDVNRITQSLMIDLSGILAYRHEEHALAAFNIVTAGARTIQFRIVKLDVTMIKRFVSGAPD